MTRIALYVDASTDGASPIPIAALDAVLVELRERLLAESQRARTGRALIPSGVPDVGPVLFYWFVLADDALPLAELARSFGPVGAGFG